MIFRFLLRGGIPKKSKAVELAAPPTLTGTSLSLLPKDNQLFLIIIIISVFFLTTIIPENHHFFPRHDYQEQSLHHCRHHHQYRLYRHLTDSPSLSSISTKRHGLISHSFEDSLRAIEVVFVLGMYTPI